MKKTIIILTLLMFLAGCQTEIGQRIFGGSKEVPMVESYLKGINGLKMEFTKDAPPVNAFMDDTFDVKLRLSNIGAHNIEKNSGYLLLTYAISELTLKDATNTKNLGPPLAPSATSGKILRLIGDTTSLDSKIQGTLQGKDKFRPEGYFYDEKYKFTAIQQSARETIGSILRAKACYKYKTVASAGICINTAVDPKERELQQGTCDPKQTITLSGGQGSPVEITKIEQRTTTETSGSGTNAKKIPKVTFDVYVKNSGGGNVVEKEKFASGCTASSDVAEPVIYIDEVRFSGYSTLLEDQSKKINCPKSFKPKEFVDRPSFSCSLTINDYTGHYTTPLSIELSYGYEQDIKSIVTISKKT